MFESLARAQNLELFTPPWLSFHIQTPKPIRMGEGALVDYRLRLRGLFEPSSACLAGDPPAEAGKVVA